MANANVNQPNAEQVITHQYEGALESLESTYQDSVIDLLNQATDFKKRKTVGMDMEPPYSVYLDGDVVATFSTEQEACELFNKLAGRSRVATQSQ